MTTCPTCGAGLDRGLRFCTSCGSPVADGEQPTVPVVIPQPADTPPPMPGFAPAPPPPAEPVTGQTPPPPDQEPAAPGRTPAPAPPGFGQAPPPPGQVPGQAFGQVPGQGPGGPGVPPVPPVAPTAEAAAQPSGGKKGGAGKKVLLVAGIIAVLGIGAFFAKGLFSSSQGASSPEAAVESLTDALNNEDPAAAASAIVPDEVRSLGNVFEAAESQAQKTGLAPKSKPYGGIDVVVEDLEFDVEELSDDVAKVTVTDGSISYKVKDSELGEGVKDLADGSDFSDGGTLEVSDFDDPDSSVDIDGDPYVIAVKRDGGWYVSLAYTAAEYYATAQDLPEGDFDPSPTESKPAKDPEEAVRQFAEAVGNVDLEATAASTPSDEWSVLDVYSRAIEETISDAQDEGDLDGVDFSIDDVELETKDLSDGAKKVIIKDASGDVSWNGYDGQEDREWDFDGKCLAISQDGDDDGENCIRNSDSYWGRSLGFDDAYVVVVKEGDGWVVSPMATLVELAKEVVPKITSNMVYAEFGRPDLAAPGKALEPGDAVDVKLNEAGFATLPFNPTADRVYAISSDEDSWVDVYDEDGEIIWDSTWAGDSYVYDLSKGSYKIVVSRDEYDGGAPAQVRAIRIDTQDLPGGTLDGDPLEGTVGEDQPLAVYRFSPADDMSVSMGSDGDDIDATVYDSSGEYVCSTSETCELYGGEDYELQISSWDSEPADYSITFTTGGSGGIVTGDDYFSGYLGSGEYLEFTVDADDSIEVTVYGDDGGDIDCQTSDGSSFEEVGDESFTITGSIDVTCAFYGGDSGFGGGSGSYSVDTYGD